jgi:hypothetical protein
MVFVVPTKPELTSLPIGPGNCLGLLAAKSSPTAVRGQFYGVAAAVGKVGAFVGIWGTFTVSFRSFGPTSELSHTAFPPMIKGSCFHQW